MNILKSLRFEKIDYEFFLVTTAVVLLGTWVLFWIVNGVVWLASLDINFIGLFTEKLAEKYGFFWKIVCYMCQLEWVYPLVYLVILANISKDLRYPPKGMRRFVGILTLFIIMVYDVRIATVMPGFIASFLHFFQDTCAAHLISGVSWLNKSMDTEVTDGLYFTVFDVLMVLTYLLWCWNPNPKRD